MKDPQFDSYASGYKDIVKNSAGIIPIQEDFYLVAKIEMLSERISNLPAGAKILDFGCGVGGLAIPLSQKHPDKIFYAFDVSAQSVEKIAERGFSNIICLSDEEELIATDMRESFDFIFSVNVFHHIEKADRLEKTRMLNNLLKAKGRLHILEHNPLNPLTRIVVSRCEFDEGVELLGIKELKNLLEKNALVVDKHEYILFFPFRHKAFSWIEKKISFLPFGAQHFIEGVKK